MTHCSIGRGLLLSKFYSSSCHWNLEILCSAGLRSANNFQTCIDLIIKVALQLHILHHKSGKVFKNWASKLSLGRPYPFKFFKGCLSQILFGPFLNTLPQITHLEQKSLIIYFLKPFYFDMPVLNKEVCPWNWY